MLTVDALLRKRRTGAQDLLFGRVNEVDTVFFRKGEDLPAAHGLADGDALGDGRRGHDGLRLCLSVLCRTQQRVAVLALQGDDLREAVNYAAVEKMLQRIHRAEEERTVSDRDHQIGRDTPQLLEDLVDILI